MFSKREPNEETSRFKSSTILPLIEPIASSLLKNESLFIPEVTRGAIFHDLNGRLTNLLSKIPLQGEQKRSPPTTADIAAAEAVSLIAKEIISQWLLADSETTPKQVCALMGELGRLYYALRSPEDFITRIERLLISVSIGNAEWAKLFAQETSYNSIGRLLAHVPTSISKDFIFSCTSYRDDIEQVISTGNQGTGTQFNICTGWYSGGKIDGETAAQYEELIESWAPSKAFKRFNYAQFLPEELSQYAADPSKAYLLSGIQIDYFPLSYGEHYLSALYSIRTEQSPKLNIDQKKNLLLATGAASVALARVARIRNSSPDFS